MVGIDKMTDKELEAIVRECAAGGDAYVCAMDELKFRDRNPEYKVAA